LDVTPDGRFLLFAYGRWLAYTSDESGRTEVYVTSFPGREGKWQISSAALKK